MKPPSFPLRPSPRLQAADLRLRQSSNPESATKFTGARVRADRRIPTLAGRLAANTPEARQGGDMHRISILIVAAALSVTGCARDTSTDVQTASQNQSGGTISDPPIELGSNPAFAAANDQLVAIADGNESGEASVAGYDFAAQKWTEYPLAPALASLRAAIADHHLILVGLGNCPTVRCADAMPTVAVLDLEGGDWSTSQLGSETSSDDFALDDIGGRSARGDVAYFTMSTHVLAVSTDGSTRLSEPLPLDLAWQICAGDAGIRAFAPSPEARTLPREALFTPTLANGTVYALPESFGPDSSWAEVSGSNTRPLAASDAPVAAACGVDGPLLADATHQQVHQWSDEWRSDPSSDAPKASFVFESSVTDSGESILQTGDEVLRLNRPGQGRAPAWHRTSTRGPNTSRPLSLKIVVVGDRVVAYEAPADQPQSGTLRELDV